VREVVMMGRYPHFGGRPGPHDEQIVDEVMAHFDVTECCNRNYQTLSGGEMQRVNGAIRRCFVCDGDYSVSVS